MKLIKYDNQVSPFDAIFERFNQLPSFDRTWPEFENGTALSTRLPRTNVQETDDAYVLTLEMPGLSKENIEVNFEDDQLVVKGEKSEQKEDKGVVRREYHSTRYERSFHVNGVNRDKVSARMENGILHVTLPKTAERLGRKIDVA